MFYIPAINVEGHVFLLTQTLGSELRRMTEDELGILNNPNSIKWFPSYGTNDRGVRGELLAP